MACNDSSAPTLADTEWDTDTVPVITGRDSVHKVPGSGTTSTMDSSSIDSNVDSNGVALDSGTSTATTGPGDTSTDGVDSVTTATDFTATDNDSETTAGDSATADWDSVTVGSDSVTSGQDSATALADSETVEQDSQTVDSGFGADSSSSTDTLWDTETETVASTDMATDVDTETETQSPPVSSWTMMLYLAADSNLEADMMQDLAELAAVEAPEWLNILVLFDRHQLYDTTDGNWTGTRLFRVNHLTASGLERLADPNFLGLTDTGDEEELDMGDGNTLDNFIQYATGAFPAQHYALVLSGHGNGWMKKGGGTSWYQPKVICTDDSGSSDGMSVQQVLAPLLQSYDIDVLGFDACLMGMVEVAWAVKETVKYVVASEANEVSTGWDYLTWFTEWLKSADFSALSLAQKQVVAYRRYYSLTEQPWQVTMSVVDTAMLDALGEAINSLVANHPNRDFVVNAMTFDADYDDYYDLWDIADLAGDDDLKAALEAAVIHNWYSTGPDAPGGLSIMYLNTFPLSYLQTPFCIDLDWC